MNPNAAEGIPPKLIILSLSSLSPSDGYHLVISISATIVLEIPPGLPFSFEYSGLLCCHQSSCNIMKKVATINRRYCRHSYFQQDELIKGDQEMLKTKLIQRSSKPFP